jgi:hypothetical protein
MFSGTTKKFLYSGPKKDASGEEQWIFTPRKENNPVSCKCTLVSDQYICYVINAVKVSDFSRSNLLSESSLKFGHIFFPAVNKKKKKIRFLDGIFTTPKL